MKKGYVYKPWWFFFREYLNVRGDWSLSKDKALVTTEDYFGRYYAMYNFEEIPEEESRKHDTMKDHWPGGAK